MQEPSANVNAKKLKRFGLAKRNGQKQPAKAKKTRATRPEALRTLLKDHLPRVVEPGAMANALIASIGEGLIIINEYGEISQVNQPALDILGYERRELVGNWLPLVLPSFDKNGREIPTTERLSTQSLLTGQSVSDVIQYRRKDSSLVPVYDTASPLMVRGKPAGAVIVFRDVSREMQVERAKDEFVSIASHQLRTPLTSIKMFAELLQDSYYGKLTTKQRDYLDKILFSTEKMIELVTDLLSISRLNLGQLLIQPIPTNINRLIDNQVSLVKPLAEERKVKLSFSSSVPDSVEVLIDRNLLSQVIHNLLTNAVRYSRARGGIVRVRLQKQTKNYLIEVADNGIGIPRSVSHRVFERFFRADNAILSQGDGTGLGLYLVKEIIAASGGRTWFKSQENKGTTFYITIPIKGMSNTQLPN